MAISRETVEHVAKLSKLALSEQEIESFTAQIDHIVAMLDTLDEVDTTDIPATTNVIHDYNRWREDIAETGDNRDTLMQNAPVHEDGYIKVPAMLKEGGEA